MLLFYAERTLPYGKRADSSSLSQITDGISSRKKNEWIRGPSGVSATAAKKANKTLCEKGFLVKRPAVPGETRYRPDRGNEATEYEINWAELNIEFNTRRQAPLGRVVSKPLGHVVPNNRGKSSSEGKRNRGTSKKRAAAESPEPFSEDPLPNKADDEAPQRNEPKSTASRDPAPTPEEEFRLRLEERHGKKHAESDRNEWIANIRSDLDVANLSLQGFLALDCRKTTNPAAIENPAGYYRSLVKELRVATKADILESLVVIDQALSVPPQPQSLCKCKFGRFSFENDDDPDSYCPDCLTGRDLWRYQQKKISKRDPGSHPQT